MANLTETPTYDAGVYRIELTDAVQGGENGISNKSAKNLANRTAWLKQQVDGITAKFGGWNGVTTIPSGTTINLTAGNAHLVTGLSRFDEINQPMTLNLPSATAAGAGAAILIIASSISTISTSIGQLPSVRGTLNVSRTGSDLIRPQNTDAGTTSISLINGESITLVSNGSNRWLIQQWQIADNILPGTVAHYASINAPSGWLACNGAAVSRTLYSALFSRIGTTFGVGDGTTTFNLPDLRGEFIRGFDGGRGIDVSRVFGSAQAQSIQQHNHLIPTYLDDIGSDTVVDFLTGKSSDPANIFTANTGGSETRPRNIALLPIIKF